MSENEEEDTLKTQDLFMKYSQDIWVFIYSVMKKQDIADDLTQEVFVRVLNKKHKIPELISPRLWIFSIARNVCRDYFKRAYFRRVSPSPRIESVSLYSVESEAISQLSIQRIWDIVTRLKQKHAEVVILRLKYDMSFEDIAYVLNVNRNTVRTRYQRAISLLRKKLKGAGYHV